MSQLLVHLKNISKTFACKSLFDGICLSISRSECFALIGDNGVGKSTLLKILTSIEDVDGGTIELAPALRINYLTQESNPCALCVREYLRGRIGEIEIELQSLQDHLDNPDILQRWSQLYEEFEQRGGYRNFAIEEQYQNLCLSIDLDQPLDSLSSGQRRQIDLAKALMDDPDLLLLDEPTNHLDHQAIQWLTKQLQKRKGATVIVSHDRRFLNETCNRLLEIKRGKISQFGGNYDFYLRERERLVERQILAYEEQQEERARLKREIKAITFSKGKPPPPKDRNIMSYDRHGEMHQSSLRHRLDQLKERLAKIEANPLFHPRPQTVTGIVFAKNAVASSIAIEWSNVSKAFDEKPVLNKFSGALHGKERLILKGPNGCGKTTFLKCLLQELPQDEGTIRMAPTIRIAYLDQAGERVPLDQTPIHYFGVKFGLSETLLRSELHKAGLEGGDLLHKPFGSMSPGERKRLMILSLILTKPNALILDEPTHHLDLTTLEALEKALLQFPGAILAVSHDETFIKKIATRLLSFF